jgi:uncharacterized protein (TIGR03000 family)
MTKFGTLVAVACYLILVVWANPAQAQFRDGNRGGIFARGNRGSSYVADDGSNMTTSARPMFRNRTRSSRRMGTNERAYVPVANVGVMAGPAYVYGSDASTAMVVGSVGGTPNVQTRRSFYSPAEMGDRASIEVLLPDASAQVRFDDSKTEETGTDRLYTSPALNPGKTYTYTVKAQWTDKGEEVTRTADVRVQAGRVTLVDFRGKGDIRELKAPLQP